ncbi:MAG: phage portal protein [Bacteroidetes bacterium]|nr:phage portal protein [Bacteroidota bacterium]
MFFRRNKKKPQIDKTTQEIFDIEVQRQAQKLASRQYKSSLSGLTGSELLAAAISGDDELLLTGGRRRITEFKTDKSFAEKYEGVAWVYICVNANARNISGVPLLIVDENGENIDHPFQQVLNQPNSDLTIQELLERTMINLETSGKVLWELQTDKKDDIVNMYCLEGWRIEAIPAKERNEREIIGFKYTTDEKDSQGKQKVINYEPDEAVYFRYFNPLKPHDGLSPIACARLQIQSDIYATMWNKTFFEEETEPRGTLETDKNLQPDEAEWIRAQFEKKHKGISKAHRVAVLPNGIKYQNTTVSHADMDFLNQSRNIRSLVASIYGVPLPVVGFYDSESSSGRSAGVEQYMERYWTQTLIPKMQKIVIGLNESIGKRYDPPIYFAFDLDSIEALQGNQLEQARAAKLMVGTGLTWNEIRQKAYTMSEIPGMDWIPIPMNVIPAGDTGIEQDSFNIPKKKLLLTGKNGMFGKNL